MLAAGRNRYHPFQRRVEPAPIDNAAPSGRRQPRRLRVRAASIRETQPPFAAPVADMTEATLAIRPRRLPDLPGPPGLPLLGSTLQIVPDRFHLQLEGWSRTYGDPFRLRMGARQVLVVADPAAIAAALRDRPAVIGRTQRLVAAAEELGFGGVFASNGETWRRQRPMVMAAFDPGHIKTYFPSLVNITRRFRNRWQGAAARGDAIDLNADLMRYTVDVIAGLALGADINTLESDDDIIQRHLDKIFPAMARRLQAPYPYWRYVRLPADRRLDRHVTALKQAVQGFIAQARARLAAEPALHAAPANLIEAMIVARDNPGSGLTDRDVAGNVLTMLLAGEDTTANTLAWMIYLLSRHPDALDRARAEVRTVLGEDREPTRLEQLAAMDYVESCAHETMRLKPVAPIQVQQAARDTVVAGVEMPARGLMIFLTRPAAMDARHFAEPEAFDPARWSKDQAATHAAPHSAKRVSMPFGAGPRICPGRYLALLEMKMAIAMLLANFEIDSVTTPDGGPARERQAFTMSPVGLKLRLRARQA
jgi:cytochrome P450